MSEIEIGKIRQGDILLIPVDDTPPSSAQVANRIVLAEGEMTGHNHVLTADTIITWGDLLRVVSDDAGYIRHEDHDPEPVQVIVPGQTYRIVRQSERTLDGLWRTVQD